VVFGPKPTVSGFGIADDLRRIVVVGPNTHIEVPNVGHDPDLGGSGGRRSFYRLYHCQGTEGRCPPPGILVQNTVDTNLFLRTSHDATGAILG
jgi:hypothetical protein